MSTLDYIEQELKRLPVPQRKNLSVRQWLECVRDWGQLDTRPLLEEIEVDEDTYDAVAAVIDTGKNAWEAFAALRSFCVQRLFGAQRGEHEDVFRPLAGVSPFSVPVELMRSVFTFNDRPFNPICLGTRTVALKIPIGDIVDAAKVEHVPQDRCWLMTTLWARVFPAPKEPLWGTLELRQLGTNRIFKHSLLAALTRPQPMFLFFSPNDGIEVKTWDVNTAEHHDLFVFVEGWTYTPRL